MANPKTTTAEERRGATTAEPRSRDGVQTVLHQTAHLPDPAHLRQALESDGDGSLARQVNWRTSEGKTALYIAVTGGFDENVRLLLAAGADPTLDHPHGWLCLHEAAGNGRADIAALLLDAGANLEAKSSWGFTALHAAAIDGRTDAIDFLLWAGAEIDARDCEGDTPLAAAIANGHAEASALLLDRGADPFITTSWGENLLQTAASTGLPDIVHTLAIQGIDIHARDAQGMTALHHAAASGNEASVRLLCDLGADVKARDKVGRRPLHHAALSVSPGSIDVLVRRGAEVNVRDRNGKTALHLATRKRGQTCLVFWGVSWPATRLNWLWPVTGEPRELKPWTRCEIIREGIDAENLPQAYEYSYREARRHAVASLLKFGSEPDIEDRRGKTALQCAAHNGLHDIVDQLLAAGAEARGIAFVEQKKIDACYRVTPLDAARAFACSVNRLSTGPVLSFIAPDAVFVDDAGLGGCQGRDAVRECLEAKFEVWIDGDTEEEESDEQDGVGEVESRRVWAELSMTNEWRPGGYHGPLPAEPCVLLVRNAGCAESESVEAVVLLEVAKNLITRIEISTLYPDPSEAYRSGVYPSGS